MSALALEGTASVDRRSWLTLAAMTGSLSMILLDQTVVSVALPTMSRDLPLSTSGAQWVVNAYVLAMAAFVALGGKLGSKLGPVSTFRVGVVVFFVASAFCGFAPVGDLGETWLICARVVQGIGAALMMPVTATIVIAAFPESVRGRAMGAYVGIGQIFLALGPLLGGACTEWLSWRVVFWLNVPVGLAALVLVHVAKPQNDKDSTLTVACLARRPAGGRCRGHGLRPPAGGHVGLGLDPDAHHARCRTRGPRGLRCRATAGRRAPR